MVMAKSPRLCNAPRPNMSLSAWMPYVLLDAIRASILSMMLTMRDVQSAGPYFMMGLYH